MITYLWQEMFDGITECRPRHGWGVAVEIVAQPLLVAFSSLSNPATHRLLDQIVRVVREDLSDAEGVVEVAAADEEPRAHDGTSTLKPVRGGCQLIERFPRLVP